MLRPTIFASAAALAALLGGCAGEPTTSDAAPRDSQGIVAGTLSVSAARPALTLRNSTEFVVGYMITDKDMATVALFPPCGTQCPTLVQGASATVNYTAIAGYTNASTEAIVLWWKYRKNADGSLTAIDGVQTTRVAL
jgi:hypothetical protein